VISGLDTQSLNEAERTLMDEAIAEAEKSLSEGGIPIGADAETNSAMRFRHLASGRAVTAHLIEAIDAWEACHLAARMGAGGALSP
jgi:hypothetical protein